MIPAGFKPTTRQTGHAIGGVVGHMAVKLAATADPDSLRVAGCTPEQYGFEVLLLAASAAMHAVESSGLGPAAETEVASGLFDWVRELREPERTLLLEWLDVSTDLYAEAAGLDAAQLTAPGDLSEIEAVFGDRLLSLGETNETRGRLCLARPKTLWAVQLAGANQMLVDAGLLSPQ